MSYSYVDSGYDQQCCENKVDIISLLVTLFAIGANVVSISNLNTNSLVSATFNSGKKVVLSKNRANQSHINLLLKKED